MHNARMIHHQRLDGCPPYDRVTKGVSSIVTPAKMSVPPLPSGVEQLHAAASPRILRCDLRTLRVVANRACIAQIVRPGWTT